MGKDDLKILEQSIGEGKTAEVTPFLKTWLSRWKRLYIGGEWRDGASGETFRTLNPATEEELSEVCLGKKADVDLAVELGRAVFQKGDWRGLSVKDRAQALRRIADLILEHRAPLAILESLDTGKPIRESFEEDIPRSAEHFRFYSQCDFPEPPSHLLPETHTSYREPLGVVGLVTSWTFPLCQQTWRLAPALLMGNSCVLKPSEHAPLTASYLAELIGPTLPPGVFNLVQGLGGAAAGEFLTSHSDLDAVSFCGSTATGRQVMMSAGGGPTRVSMELSGKGASIVFADADLEKAVETSVKAAFRNQGEMNTAHSRIYVAQEIYGAFVEALVQQTKKIVVGDPLAYATTLGALIGEEHYKKVSQYIRKVEFPANVETGGVKPEKVGKGYYLDPTVITGLQASHVISKEEILGPIVSVYSFQDETQAISAANATTYGFSASIWTADRVRALRVSKELRCGIVWINAWGDLDLSLPFGGQKRSGLGREGGDHSLNFFSDLKNVI